jgi:XTP/dITP diphosphohydrolase
MMRRRVVVASGNPGKLRELQALLDALGLDVVPQSEFGIEPPPEPHPTFVENALAKARHAARGSGLPAIADDSGVCVDALGGAPGVLSARYAGEPADDARNNLELLRRLHGIEDRRAHYTCVVVALRTAEDPDPRIADARWHGEVLREPRGSHGFGYDPLFLIPALGLSAAELEPAQKNRISHRALAIAELARKLGDW